MTPNETITLFWQGREAWNAWARKLLSERKELEDQARWAADRDGYGNLQPRSDETRKWLEAAKADFSGYVFSVRGADNVEGGFGDKTVVVDADLIDFRGFLFPCTASFQHATFTGDAHFSSALFSDTALFDGVRFSRSAHFSSVLFSCDARFLDAQFGHQAHFPGAVFSGDAVFERASFTHTELFTGLTSFERATMSGSAYFHRGALFERAIFSCAARFGSAIFWRDARFDNVTFKGIAKFDRAYFKRNTYFDNGTFMGVTRFYETIFEGNAYFQGASFQKSAAFSKASFLQDADLTDITAERAFYVTGATFTEVPAFNQADFKHAPDLDGVRFPLPFWTEVSARYRESEVAAPLIARYRALRRIAILGADPEQEQMALKGEIRSKRGSAHKWYHAALWYGLAYDALSDFGRSMSRPLAAWFISIAIFTAFYLLASGTAGKYAVDCAITHSPHYKSALVLSLKNALPVIGIGSKAEHAAQQCLYENDPYGGIILQGLQNIWSAVLIFLFLLAVRNQFRIK